MKPNLLFLTPTLPHTAGAGSSIRAGLVVESLARHFNVHVLHAELWGWRPESFKTDFVRQHAASYVYHVPQNGALPMPQILAEHFGGIQFQAIHAFRLVMARAAVSVMQQGASSPPFSVLDLDDDECFRADRFVDLREETGDNTRARLEQRATPQLNVMERMLLPRFQAVCLAALADCERVSRRNPGAQCVHLPNAVFLPDRIPARDGQRTSAERSPTLLLVGTLDYFPNEDGAQYFCQSILPLIRQKHPGPLRVRIVGSNPKPQVTMLAREPDVEVFANVPEVASFYEDADVAIVPLRAGSGTRIKILEAFSLRKPVVSTSIGAEGLSAIDGKDLLIADDPESFAGACVTLLQDAALRAKIAESAWEWLLANHSIDRIDEVIRSLYEPVLAVR